MKQICYLLLAILSWASPGLAQNDRQELSKPMQKECKRVLKQLKQEGWTVWGKPQTLQSALEQHYLALEQAGPDAVAIEGRATGKDANIAQRRAQANASKQYATMKESQVQVESNIAVETEQGQEAATNTQFNSSYTSRSEQQVRSFSPSITLTRTLADGNVEVQSFYIVK